MSPVKRERLFAKIPAPRASKYGITPGDILRIPAAPELVTDLLDCLHSDDELDLIFGLMFAEHLRSIPDFCNLAEPSLPALLAAIRSALAHSSSRVRAGAVLAFVAFRASYDDYVVTMREQLAAADPQPRQAALAAAPTYLAAEDLDALLPFRDDSEVSETRCIGGPLRFTTRDLALEVAERIAGRQFPADDCFERVDGSRVSWRSWSSFTRWLDSNKK